MRSFCIKCNGVTNQVVLKEVKRNETNDEDGWWEDISFQIIECAGCNDISFRKLYNDISMQQSYDEDTTTQELFPQRGPHIRSLKIYRGLPFAITRVYRETVNAYNSELLMLAGVGVRAIIEAICLDKNITSGTVIKASGAKRISFNLDGKIAGLAENGFLTHSNGNVLHELRFMGNDAVHELYEPPPEELNTAFDIIELVIDNIYVVSRKASDLKRRRETRKK